jgi:hypothetical protein
MNKYISMLKKIKINVTIAANITITIDKPLNNWPLYICPSPGARIENNKATIGKRFFIIILSVCI